MVWHTYLLRRQISGRQKNAEIVRRWGLRKCSSVIKHLISRAEILIDAFASLEIFKNWIGMRLVLDGIEDRSYKPAHIVRLYEGVPTQD